MKRGFDNLTLPFYEKKLYDHDKDKDKVYKPLDNENKFLNPTWIWGHNNTRLAHHMGAESK